MIKTNKTIIHISMKRSGCNAISRFLYRLYDDPKFAIGGKRVRICNGKERLSSFKKIVSSDHGYDPKFYNLFNYKIVNNRPDYLFVERHDHTNLMLLRYEDISINGDYFYCDNIYNWDVAVGQCSDVTFVLSMRDPFNMMSSVINHKKLFNPKKYNKKSKKKSLRKVLSRLAKWKQHANEFLGKTNYLPNDKIFINYNEWVVNQDYRNGIASKFNNNCDDSEWNILSPDGGGSTFDKMNCQDVCQMDIFNRWKVCVKDELKFDIFREIFKDKEIINLSSQIFGHIDGTEIFYE
jgi:hypothetical protein